MTASTRSAAGDASTTHLLRRIEIVAARAVEWVSDRRMDDPRRDDLMRGLYLTREDVLHVSEQSPYPPSFAQSGRSLDAQLARVEAEADTLEAAGEALRIRGLSRTFGLSASECDLLMIVLAPELDRRLEPCFGYLNDDVGRRRATPSLALPLAGLSLIEDRGLLAPDSALLSGGLIVMEDSGRPFLSREMRVPDRVCRHLLGDDRPEAAVADLLSTELPHLVGDSSSLAQILGNTSRLCYLRGEFSAGSGWARAAFAALGSPALVLDLGRSSSLAGIDEIASAALLEARLSARGLVVGPIDGLESPAAVRKIAELPWPVVLLGSRSWDSRWARDTPLVLDVPPLVEETRRNLWRTLLAGRCADDVDPGLAADMFALSPDGVARAALGAWLRASFDGRLVESEDVRHGARSQNSSGLEQLAYRITPEVSLAELVLPDEERDLVAELVIRARQRSTVLDNWGLRQTGRRGDGISALFSGPPGTGKTMAAEAVAGELGLELYAVELATVVDKYIGETEKNLERIFQQAQSVNGILLFDEADALFGKRSEVNDARDRYANVEVAYLLQRMEAFDGLAILATNLRMNLDEAFTRRLDVIVDFPLPDVDQRLRLWRRSFGTATPLAADVDLEYCAATFELSGGDIRNVTLSAAYLAADARRSVLMSDIQRAVEREYRKLGRLFIAADVHADPALVRG